MSNSKNLSRLKEALDQLRSFKGQGINAYSAEFKSWRERTHRVLHESFGTGQYLSSFNSHDFCEARVHFGGRRGTHEPEWLPMDQRQFDADALAIDQLLRDAIEDVSIGSKGAADPPDSTAFTWGLIHPTIRELAEERFNGKQYADAAEAALKAVNARVKEVWRASGKEEKDGKGLMLAAFSVNQPAIRLADLSTLSGRDIQEGYMHLFAGAIQAIRNPKAHEIIDITPERCLHFLIVGSLLMWKLDEAV